MLSLVVNNTDMIVKIRPVSQYETVELAAKAYNVHPDLVERFNELYGYAQYIAKEGAAQWMLDRCDDEAKTMSRGR